MKVRSVLLMIALLSLSSWASADNIFNHARELVLKCAVQPISISQDGHKVGHLLKSICPELKVVQNQVYFELDQRHYVATMTVSPLADGDDLNNLVITNDRSKIIARRTNILSFSDPLMALAGGQGPFRQETYVP